MLNIIIEADYKKHMSLFEKEINDKKGIVILGDSIIKYWPTAKFYQNSNIINRGIPGDTAKGVLERIDDVVNLDPKVVIINIGSNDLVRTDSTINEIVKRILQIKFILESKLEDTKVYLLTLPPVLRDHEITSEAYMQHRTNEMINEINEELLLFTNLIDTSSILSDIEGNLKLEYTVDGLHLTDLGYKIFSETIASSVEELKLRKEEN